MRREVVWLSSVKKRDELANGLWIKQDWRIFVLGKTSSLGQQRELFCPPWAPFYMSIQRNLSWVASKFCNLSGPLSEENMQIRWKKQVLIHYGLNCWPKIISGSYNATTCNVVYSASQNCIRLGLSILCSRLKDYSTWLL